MSFFFPKAELRMSHDGVMLKSSSLIFFRLSSALASCTIKAQVTFSAYSAT